MSQISSDSTTLFKGRHFDSSIIILCERWYITYKLSYRDLHDIMAECGVTLAHTTILRWVLRYVPVFEKKWNRFTRPVGRSWRVDETYIRVRREWKYLYRAVDKQGKTVDFLLSEHRDVEAAKRFFTQAINNHRAPEKITIDGYAATHRAVRELKESAILPINVCVRTSKYLNNMVEQEYGHLIGFLSLFGFSPQPITAGCNRALRLTLRVAVGFPPGPAIDSSLLHS